MSTPIPSTDEPDTPSDDRLASLIALCLLITGTLSLVTGAVIIFGFPVGLLVLGVLLLGAGIALGFR